MSPRRLSTAFAAARPPVAHRIAVSRQADRPESADSCGTARGALGGAHPCGIYGRFLANHWTAHFAALLALSFFLYFLFLSTYSVNPPLLPLPSLYRRRRLPCVAAACAVRCR